MSHLLLLPLIVFIDVIFGEPRRYHPLVGFGYLANKTEKAFNNNTVTAGLLSWVLVIVPLVAITWILSNLLGGWFDVLIGYLALGAKSLWQHAKQVQLALEDNDIVLARERVGWIVSRDTSQLNEEEVSKAAVESLLENGSDAIFATLFWFAVAGAEGVILYRLSNTLDAMWGYRTERYLLFGRVAARFDDILNWIPARLTALSYSLYGDFKTAWHCWQTQGTKWYSPNAGPVMAAGAGALGLKLGGDAIYHGQLKSRLTLGAGHLPKAEDITRAWKMILYSMISWCVIAIFIAVLKDVIN